MIQQSLVIWSLVPLAFSKSSLNIWTFTVHILLKPGLENFECYLANVWNDFSCAVVWTFFSITFFGGWNKSWSLPVLWPLLSFPNVLALECSTFTSSSFRIWNSSVGIPSSPLALLVVMFPKALLTSHSKMSGSRCLITPLWISGSLKSFFV